MEDFKQIGSAEAIKELVKLAHTAADTTLNFHLRVLKIYQLQELIQAVRLYLLDNGIAGSACFKLCGIDLVSGIPIFEFTDPIDIQIEAIQLHSLPFETKLFLIEIIEKL